MEQPPLWLAICTDIAQILTPIVAIIGFVFAFMQISVAKKQAVEARRQAELMGKQLELEIQARKDGNTPYFDLVLVEMYSSENTDKYNFALYNYGLSTAFQLSVGYYQQNRTVEVPSIAEFEAIPVGNNKGFIFQYPTANRMDVIELYVNYKNIYGDCFYQSWGRIGGLFKPLHPPTIDTNGRSV